MDPVASAALMEINTQLTGMKERLSARFDRIDRKLDDIDAYINNWFDHTIALFDESLANGVYGLTAYSNDDRGAMRIVATGPRGVNQGNAGNNNIKEMRALSSPYAEGYAIRKISYVGPINQEINTKTKTIRKKLAHAGKNHKRLSSKMEPKRRTRRGGTTGK